MKERNLNEKNRNYETDAEEDIGRDVRDILNSKKNAGPQILPDTETKRTGTKPSYPPPEETPEEKKARKKAGAPYVFVSYAFVFIFILLIGYLVYFNVFLKDKVLSSPYNKRSDALAEYVVRGSIKSSDGEILARTETDSSGNETRSYPYANLFAHTVGYATNGKSGIESIANYDLLTSHYNFIDRLVNEFQNKKNPGDTVVTTLSAKLQKSCYDALGDYNGAVVVMNPKTGEVLAMVSKPDFDPNTLSDDWQSIVSDENSTVLLNRATQGLYAPGSTFKIVTALSYFRKNATFDGFSFNCEGEFTYSDHTVHCYDGEVHGQEDFTGAFANSCNCAFASIGLSIGADALKSTSEDLLFNKTIPTGLAYNKSKFSLTADEGDAAMMQTAFGQGNTLTSPYHMALIVSAIANDGVLMKPELISRIENASGDSVSETQSEKFSTLMTKTEAEQLRNLMAAAVSGGTAKELSGLSYSAGGKTGSAEYTKADGTTGTNSWFVGYAGKDTPEVVISVLAEDGGAGSETAVPIAHAVFDTFFENK